MTDEQKIQNTESKYVKRRCQPQKKLRHLDVPPCSLGPTPSICKGQTLLPEHSRRSIEGQPVVHINGWLVAVERIFQRAEGCAVLLLSDTAVGRVKEKSRRRLALSVALPDTPSLPKPYCSHPLTLPLPTATAKPPPPPPMH